MDLVMALGIGLLLGVVTGMPLGVINVAIVDAAAAGDTRYARGVGIGGAFADTVHAVLAFVGIGRVIAANPAWSRTLAIVAATIIVAYAAFGWRRRRVVAETPNASRTSTAGIAAGLVLTLPNPGALGAWVAVAALWPRSSIAESCVLAVGVGIGSAIWFTSLARWVARVPRDHKALAIIPRAALVLFVVIAVVGVVRTL